MLINKQDTNGTKPLLSEGELGYDKQGADRGRVYVGGNGANIPLARQDEKLDYNIVNEIDTVKLVSSAKRKDWTKGISAFTGLIKIELVSLYGYSMDGRMSIRIKSALTNQITINVDGQWDATTHTWVASNAISDNGITVRFCRDASKVYIVIGETSTVWANTRVEIDNVLTNYNSGLNLAFTIGTVSSLTGLTIDSIKNSSIFTDISVHNATSKATPVDADEIGLLDSTSLFSLKKLTWANFKATLSSLFMSKVTSTDNAVVRFNGTTGEVQNSGVIIDDNGSIATSTTQQTLQFTALAQSTNTAKFEIGTNQVTIKDNGSYTFLSTIEFESHTNASRTITFDVRRVSDGASIYTQQVGLEIPDGDKEVIPFNSLLVVEGLSSPMSVYITAVSTNTGYTILRLNSILSLAGSSELSIANISSNLSSLDVRLDNIENVIEW